MLWRRNLATSGNGELAYEIAYIGFGRQQTLDDIETAAGVRPVPGDVLLFFISSYPQNHYPEVNNPCILLAKYSTANWEVELWGGVVEASTTNLSFYRGSYSVDDYGYAFLKRISGPVPDELYTVVTAEGYYPDVSMNNTVDEFRIHAYSLLDENGTGLNAWGDYTDTANTVITDPLLKRATETGYLAEGVFVDDGLGRSRMNQDGSFYNASAIIGLKKDGVVLT